MNFSFFQTNRFRRIKNSEKKKSKDAAIVNFLKMEQQHPFSNGTIKYLPTSFPNESLSGGSIRPGAEYHLRR